MKKKLLNLVFATIGYLAFGQSPIVTIDRANIIGPTNTGNDASISSSGLIRGSGINLASVNAANFTSNQWNATTQTGAASNNEYIEWSVSASADNSIEITEIDIRNRRNGNGPANWQIFYSLDNFATAGTSATTVQTSASTATNYNFNGLSIVSGTAGTITFRLYAWNSSTNGGWFRIARNNIWSGFGITSPGLRLTGTITTTAVNDTESNIVATNFDPSDNIDYTLYAATSGLTTTNALKIGEFDIQDGGDDLTDSDLLGTTLTNIGFDIAAHTNIEAIAIFDGTTNVGEVSVTDNNASISSLNSGSGIICSDDSTRTFDVYATFKSSVTDNDQIQLTINSAQADVTIGSSFNAFDAGGASTAIAGDDNRIEVTATELNFAQEPSNTNQFEVMSPYPTVHATDSNNNIDFDFASNISLSTTGTFDVSATTSETAVSGISIFGNLVFSDKDTAITITAASGILTSATSTTFNVNGPLITIVTQDFDGSTPEWTYSNDITFFDNGWGTDGYYGIIDIDDAAPIDNPQFSDNILGDNDLNDEGDNGTTGWATVTFSTIDISAYENVKVKFDWDVDGYANNNNDAQYRLIYDGSNEPRVFLHDGNGEPESGEGSISINVPADVDTVALEIRVRNNRLAGFSGFDNFRIVSEFDGLLYTNSTWTPNAPSSTTDADNALVLDGTYSVTSSDIEINDFIVADGATADIDKASSLTVNGNLITSGTLELDSDSDEYSSLIVEGTALGDVIYKRHVNNSAATGENDSNDLIAAPVSGEAFNNFRTNNSNIVSNGSSTSFLFGPFDKTTGAYVLYSDTETATLDAGNGYRAASTDSDTFTFTGTVNSATIDKPIINSGPTEAEWNLIGNPYPSYIRLDDFLTANSTEFDPPTAGIYGYDGDASDGWVIWNQAYSDVNPNAVITPGQGFFVSSKSGGGTISFTAMMRTTGSTDDFILGRSASSENNGFLELTLSNTNNSYKTNLYFNSNASLGMDIGYDAAIFGDIAPSFSIYSHLVENNNGKDIAVQSVGYDDLTDVIIPLGINTMQGEQVTISITSINLPDDAEVFLEDSQSNTFTNLKIEDYSFIPQSTLTSTGRFYLHFSREQLNLSENALDNIKIYTTINPKKVVLKGFLEYETRAQLFDIQGRKVNKTNLNTKDIKQSLDVSDLKSGVYIIELNNIHSTRRQKLIIK